MTKRKFCTNSQNSYETYAGLTDDDYTASPYMRYAGTAQDNFELDESYNVNINANIIDDIGISKIWIEHSIYNIDFPEFNNINHLL